jgi:hypothetical protein
MYVESLLASILEAGLETVVALHSDYSDERKLRAKEAGKKEIEKQLANIMQQLHHYKYEKVTIPMQTVISLLPKEELAILAESLINLESLSQRMSLNLETVGGPIDVAVISKNEGFEWVKRKQ